MGLPKDKIESYNKIIKEKYCRNTTKEEVFNIDSDIRRLAEIMYESYMYHKKTGRLPEIMKEIESEKIKKGSSI